MSSNIRWCHRLAERQTRPDLGDGRFFIGEWLVDPIEQVMVSVHQDVAWLSDDETDLLVYLAERTGHQVPYAQLISELYGNDPYGPQDFREAIENLMIHFGEDPNSGRVNYIYIFPDADVVLIQPPLMVEDHPLRRVVQKQTSTGAVEPSVAEDHEKETPGAMKVIGGILQFLFWLLFVIGPLVLEAC